MKRWWGIRHLRYFFWRWHFERWWAMVGQHFWICPNPADEQALERIWRGEA